MGDLLRYQKIYRLPSPGSLPGTVRRGYESWPSPRAKTVWDDFLAGQNEILLNGGDEDVSIQVQLFSLFADDSQSRERRAGAGLCLRCYISPSILQACKDQASAFAGTANRQDTFQKLLSAVLDDDGLTLWLFDNEEYCLLNRSDKSQSEPYRFFGADVLSGYNYQSPGRKSLSNWAYYVTRYHERLKTVLSEVGFQRLSNWALMNRARSAQLKWLSQRSRHLVEVFQAVYRRDRLKQRERDGKSLRAKKCPDPTNFQLGEMLDQLRELDITIQSPKILLEELRQVAQELQEIDAWIRQGRPNAEPIELPDPETGLPTERRDIASTVVNEPEKLEYEDILQFIREQQLYALQYGIQQGIDDRLTEIRKSRRKAHASKLIPGLRLIYQEGLSQRAIQERLSFPNQPLVARVLALKELIHQVRFRTLEKLLDIILVRANEMGLTAIPPQPNYLSNLMEQLELLVDAEVFDEALQELQKPNKDRSFDSLYAVELRRFLQES
ncbi:hypothetical protein XM38_036580 [Halomicronema hongdechloris C2206]|uniref:Uncharacterized protein n=1 Tax=Halomicronema hongdechloris C2206 TaxID=1641165 RepID=A0A1Z3HQW2_9CYAN|nr:hypothetical protein [Halomicronema hongdechloris]ASC72700.1 hypothetical protein XM38_036580 [Halomicronema hongdechloris C2206]